jgi:hypothetical protein
MGNLTNQELKLYLINKKLPDYITNVVDELCPLLLRELLNYGLQSQADKAFSLIKNTFTDFENYFMSKIDNLSEIREHPFLFALINRLNQLDRDIEEHMSNPDFNLIEASNALRMENVSKVVSLERDSIEAVNGMRSI